MTTATAPIPTPPAPPYRDRKRYAWLLSVLVPCIVGMGPVLMMVSGDVRALWIPVIFFYVLAPLLDWMMGEDLSNPPESAVPALDADPYYRRVTYALVPVLWVSFIFSAWFIVHYQLPPHGVVAMVFTASVVIAVLAYCVEVKDRGLFKEG